MEVVNVVTLEDVRAAKPSMIFYSVHTCWWTHDPAHLDTSKGIPMDPRGSVLFETEDVEGFLSTAIAQDAHYGKHKLRAFMAAHHQNAIKSLEDFTPVANPGWEEYNDAVDRADARGDAQAELTEKVREFQKGLAVQAEAEAKAADDGTIVARCVICCGEFTAFQLRGQSACPACGNPGLPMSPKDDLEVKINWHELRILTMWAENWAANIRTGPDTQPGYDPVKVIFAIAKRLQGQHPLQTPLTLSGEMELVKREYPGSTVTGVTPGGPVPGGEDTIG